MKKLLFAALIVIVGCKEKDEPFEPVELPDLTAEQGFGYRIPEFDVAAGEEIQDCYFFAVPDLNGDGTPVKIGRIHAGMNPGSHHFNVFRVNTILNLDGAPGTVVQGGECWKAPNWADWPLVVNTQQSSENDPYFDWTLPADVAHFFLPGEKLMLQTHYVNATTQDTPYKGKVAINFHRAPAAVSIELGTLFATQQSIRVCQSNPNPKYAGTCSFPATGSFHITGANGHFHSRGKQLQMFAWDGVTAFEPAISERFYASGEWAEPPMTIGLDVVPPAGGGVWWTCEYVWQEPPAGCDELNALDPAQANDCCYVFGPKVESGEHCNVFVYYWPKAPSGDIFCN